MLLQYYIFTYKTIWIAKHRPLNITIPCIVQDQGEESSADCEVSVVQSHACVLGQATRRNFLGFSPRSQGCAALIPNNTNEYNFTYYN